MKTKSLLISILTLFVALIATYGNLFTATTSAWLGIVSFTLTLVLSTFFASGTMPSQWSLTTWIVNVSGIVISVLNLTSDKMLLPPNTVIMIVAGINVFIQTYIKNYGSGSLTEKA